MNRYNSQAETEVSMRKHTVQLRGFGAYSLICILWDGPNMPELWE